MAYTVRRPAPDDAPAICALIQACDVAAIGVPDTTLDDIQDRFAGPDLDLSKDAWLWEDAGRPVGFVIAEQQGESDLVEIDVHCLPEADSAAPELWARAESRATEIARDQGHPQVTLDVYIYRADEGKRAAASARGYAHATSFYRMRIDHAGPSPAPALPGGVHIVVVGADEKLRRTSHEILAASFVEHFGYAERSYEWREAFYAASSTRGWDQVRVLSVDGEPAAALSASNEFVGDENCGYVATLGVLPAYRGRGLGRALLLDAFERDAADGRAGTILHVDANNVTPALGLYESVGMRSVLIMDSYRRTIAV